MTRTTTPQDDICSRCKGKGYGDWYREHGICFACRGTGKASVAKRLREKAKADMAHILGRIEVSVTVVLDDDAPTHFGGDQSGTPMRPRHRAAFALLAALGYDLANDSTMIPYLEEVEPGVFAGTQVLNPADFE